MAIKTDERAFEQEIEWRLINLSGYVKGNPGSFDRTLAMDTCEIWRG